MNENDNPGAENMRQQPESKGFQFYRSIGSPKFCVAPMVDQSELAYRMLTRKYGAELVWTQMFNANSFVSSREYRDLNFTTCAHDRPLIVQLAGHDAQTMLKAAKYVEDRCDAIDINLGCPQAIAKRGRYGAFLMEELDLLRDIVHTLSTNLKVPVTCKSRIYKDFDTSVRLYETLVEAGASMLTIHGRTREEKGHKVGSCDWEMIKRIRKHFDGRVPIFANGGIETFDDVQKCLDATECEGVMVSEAILENPTLFANNRNIDTPNSSEKLTQLDITEEYLAFCRKYPEMYHFKMVRSHIMKMMHRYFCKHTELRDRCARVHSIDELEEICKECRLVMEEDSKYTYSWYQRHRNCPYLHTGSSGLASSEAINKSMANNMLQHSIDASKEKLWENLDEGDNQCGGVFGALGMFGDDE